jgi:hypothetical protein
MILIETVENAFGTHDQKDRQDKADEASACSGIGSAETQENVPRSNAFSHLHAEEPQSNAENIKKPYSYPVLAFHLAIWGEEFGQYPLVTYNANPDEYQTYKSYVLLERLSFPCCRKSSRAAEHGHQHHQLQGPVDRSEEPHYSPAQEGADVEEREAQEGHVFVWVSCIMDLSHEETYLSY